MVVVGERGGGESGGGWGGDRRGVRLVAGWPGAHGGDAGMDAAGGVGCGWRLRPCNSVDGGNRPPQWMPRSIGWGGRRQGHHPTRSQTAALPTGAPCPSRPPLSLAHPAFPFPCPSRPLLSLAPCAPAPPLLTPCPSLLISPSLEQAGLSRRGPRRAGPPSPARAAKHGRRTQWRRVGWGRTRRRRPPWAPRAARPRRLTPAPPQLPRESIAKKRAGRRPPVAG